MEHLATTKCECGHQFTAKDIKPPLLKVNDPKLYGGNVKRQSKAECECGKTYLLWLKPEHNTYTVKTISLITEKKELAAPELPHISDREGIVQYLKVHEIKFHPNTSNEKLYEKMIEHAQGA